MCHSSCEREVDVLAVMQAASQIGPLTAYLPYATCLVAPSFEPRGKNTQLGERSIAGEGLVQFIQVHWASDKADAVGALLDIGGIIHIN